MKRTSQEEPVFSESSVNEDGTRTVRDGNFETTYDANGNFIKKVEYVYDKKGNLRETKIYDADGKIIQRTGTNNLWPNYTEDYIYDENGELVDIVRRARTSDGRLRIGHFKIDSYGDVAEAIDGWELSGYNDMLICSKGVSGAGIRKVGVQSKYGDLTWDFLSYAFIRSNTPENATRINYNDKTYRKYANYLNDKIASQITEPYGYDASEIQGYYFDSSSKVARKMGESAEFKKFLKNNLEALKKGITSPMAFSFNSGELYYSFHKVQAIDSWVDDDGKLHVVIADTYDFKGGGSGFSSAADALMQNGNLVPYYSLVEVVVDI